MTDVTGSSQYTYDRRGLLETDRKAVWDNTYPMLYAYDANGNRTTVTYPSRRVVTYGFDFADRPLSSAGQIAPNPAVTYITSAGYQPFGPVSQLKFGNATTRAAAYDTRYRITSNKLTKDAGGVVLADYHTYAYDSVGNVTAIPDAMDSTYSRTVLAYDDLNRLKTATTGSNLWTTGNYTYDSLGNVTALTVGARSVSFTYVSSGGHQTSKVATASDHSPTAVTYDTAGNETLVGANPYVYSSRNYLSSGDGFAYAYDGRGIRTAVRELKLAITNLSPVSRAAGSGAFTLTVNGSSFTGSSVVKWNGSARTTTLVSSTQLTASILSGDVASAGTVSSVTVVDGASTSNGAGFVTDFTDESSTDNFYSFVTTIAERSITTGCGGGNYCPTTSVTRAQMSVFLLVAKEGIGYAPPACTGIFADVPCPSSFANWIEELNHRGIASGCGGGNYCPNDPVTRAQMAVFLLVTLEGSGYTPPPCTGIFADVACPSTYATWVEELSRRGIASGCGAGNYCPTTAVTRAQMAVFLTKTFGFTQNATPAGQKRIFLYTPESNLAVETDYSSNYHPIVFAEHVWQGGMPVAEVDTVTSTTHWTMTDHLGTPILWTDTSANVSWRVEHEPYGRVFKLRLGTDLHQPLRLPGQEAEQIPNTGINGATEKSYNVFRWYRPNWGRYTQVDPIGMKDSTNLFQYGLELPTGVTDPYGLCGSGKCVDCPAGNWYGTAVTAEGSFSLFGVFNGGGLAFAGVMACPSDLTTNVPFITVCGTAGGGVPLKSGPSWLRRNRLSRDWKKGSVGAGVGAGGAGFRCSGAPCREQLEGTESGTYVQVGPAWLFKEKGVDNVRCIGIGGGPEAGFYLGKFTCTTTIARPWIW